MAEKKKKKSPKKKAGKKKQKKKAPPRQRADKWAWKRKRPSFLSKEDWVGILGGPQGTGHIDRFYFSNCSEDIQVHDVIGIVYPAAGGSPTVVSHPGPIGPLENGVIHMPVTFETVHVDVIAIFEDAGVMYQADYHCEIPAQYGEYINCLDVGIAKYIRGYYWQTKTFGTIFGHLGNNYCLSAADMVVYPI